eukprot:1873547-Rhodomonas_salina.1
MCSSRQRLGYPKPTPWLSAGINNPGPAEANAMSTLLPCFRTAMATPAAAIQQAQQCTYSHDTSATEAEPNNTCRNKMKRERRNKTHTE